MDDSSGETERTMKTLPNILLAVSAAGFAAGGIIDFGGFKVNPALTVALPLGAVFFGLFMIAFMMEKEMAGFDDEEAKKLQLLPDRPAALESKQKNANPSNIIQLKEQTL
jgi:hypothetical protein